MDAPLRQGDSSTGSALRRSVGFLPQHRNHISSDDVCQHRHCVESEVLRTHFDQGDILLRAPDAPPEFCLT